MSADWSQLEERAGVVFENKDLLKQAFVHRSYLNENRGFPLGHNERLEFLGDAVLELVITDYLYTKYPEKNEGEMTSLRSALVNANTLYQVGNNLGINDFLLLSRGEAKDTGRARQYILANTMESLIGAIYLDRGYEKAKDFIYTHITPLIDKVIEEESWIDAKSLFQEQAQEHDGATPAYKTLKEEGPDHDKHFTVGVYIKNDLIAEGRGDSKQDAEQDAARKALEAKGWE
ncbi:MAG: ribonuclease III [Candidatus Zambryskibacteria bacterium RIFCSPHIGHO2_01_FULL_43_27]|uniref:Ribonuclease 3 n=1 Tax=Candidatus Zambryskibacteria bacterium RIFCSPLOWO2_01_FULL_43_17 TaxID=1802760 RepID=A0A1G2U5N9_9BACT|nr:MAG: ribonuclease III [Candidatus Zambryskibacteria bacterium RIFCSPHIGHO2_01_FULL_43_27]OHA99548.1 MAG: ribonuclease III [Candidatus Zambryskibacteria bacterium RIFCSPHIGHO2_12_FULL_43_12b]OHB04803.1 MAG: ribonuclease III [Candidatus Zambryskibacteria bacterium RIFCSPLOWO2_01_FULL_43_17]